jgi:hypothetical protein
VIATIRMRDYYTKRMKVMKENSTTHSNYVVAIVSIGNTGVNEWDINKCRLLLNTISL